MCSVLSRIHPHVVFLQEVLASSECAILVNCPAYRLISGYAKIDNYYTAIMVRKDVAEVEDTVIVPFRTSMMGRNILAVKVRVASR